MGAISDTLNMKKGVTKRTGSVKRPTALSMFTGCGGMDLGFHEAGFDIVWANDINEDCAITHEHNFKRLTGHNVMHHGDISKISGPSKESVKDLDVLIGGFPCQAFSNAGNRKGVADNRGMLYTYCLDYIDAYNPKYVVFENVRGFLSIRGKDKLLIDEIAQELIAREYDVYVNLVNASDYSVPQNRLRVIMVARARKYSHLAYSFPLKQTSNNLTLRSILPVPKKVANQNDLIKLNPQAHVLGDMVPEGGSWKSIPYEMLPDRLKYIRDNMQKYRWPNFFRRFSRDEIAGTITAAFKPENAGVWHPTEKRPFTAREIARIQSFPDSFEFIGSSVKSIYQMIGNAVPPNLAKAVATSILDSMNGKASDAKMLDYYEARAKGKPLRPSGPGWAFQEQTRPELNTNKTRTKRLKQYELLDC